jgi:hypothetical protein
LLVCTRANPGAQVGDFSALQQQILLPLHVTF